MMLKTNVCVIDPFKVQDRPVDFNETEHEKFIGMVLDFILKLIFSNYSLSSFGLVSKKNVLF